MEGKVVFSSTVRAAAEPAFVDGAGVDPTDLVPLSALAAEGFGWDGPLVATPLAAIVALTAQLGGEVVLDDLGRRCASRETARRLFAERPRSRSGSGRCRSAATRSSQLAARNPVWTGLPAGWIPDEVTPAAAM